jgi:molecular chaperone GrpE
MDHSDEEINFEPEDEMGDIGAAQAKLRKLRDELTEVRAKRDEYLDGWQRAKADAVNSRKELLVTAERMSERAKESVIEDIIPVLDSFDMATAGEAWSHVDQNWRSGMEQIRNQLLGALAAHGVERFGEVGEIVDHARHEIVQEAESTNGVHGDIVRVLRSGYARGERVIRPAQVIATS